MLRALPMPSDDLRTRERILAGEPAAAEAFFRRHLEPLYEFVHYRVGGRRAEAEDIVQDTFLVAFQRLESFDGRSSLHTWLCGIARNKIRESRRRVAARPLEEVLDEAQPEIDALLASIEREPLPEWVLEERETQELVGATLASLPPDYREALVAKYVEGLSVAELARRASKGEKAAESMLHRARLAFARVFELLARRRGGRE